MEFIPDISNRYKIKTIIGSGGFSQVFKAFDIINNMECALKIIKKLEIEKGNQMDYMKNSIRREIEIMKICECKNVVKIYDSFETKDSFVLVIELCDINLMDYILKNKEYIRNIYFLQSIFLDLNNAFNVLNHNKIIHRDIKPENIFLKFEGNKIIPKLGDFGISRTYKEANNKEDKDYDINSYNSYHTNIYTNQMGTLNYMAPEVLKGETYNYKCDLYSLGVTLYKLFFLKYPFDGHTLLSILNNINKKKKLFLKSGLKSFDDLLEGLLKIDPTERLTMEDYLNHPFFKENKNLLKKCKFESKTIINDKEKEKNEQINKIDNIAKNMFDIMRLSNIYIEKIPKIANILYYDENINEYLDEIHEDSDYFERKTPGAFILTTNIISLNLVMEEIRRYNDKYDKRVIFNLIVTGSKAQKVIDDLIKYKFYDYIQNICIYCMIIEKYSYLKKKYSKIIGIYNQPSQVEKFIEKVSSEETKEFPMTKTINYYNYKDIYYNRHQKISQFYGNITKETYDKNFNKLEDFIDKKQENELKIKKNELIESFKTFDITKDIEILDKLLIKEYTKNTFYGDLNYWLRTLDKEIYETIAYFTARLMYSLNNYGLKNHFLREKKILFRGAKINYINLLSFERLKGKIIILSSFTSTSEDELQAKDWSGREKSKENFKASRNFSVIYKITNIVKKNCIPCGINIQDESEYDDEKEILFQPFTFYFVKDVFFDFQKYTVDIELETISKKEILEDKIREGKKVIYDTKLNMVIIDENNGNKKDEKEEKKEKEKKSEKLEKKKNSKNSGKQKNEELKIEQKNNYCKVF